MDTERVELLILQNLIYNEDYTRKVIPYLKEYHFENIVEKEIFTTIQSFVNTYNSIPTRQAIWIEIRKKTGIQEETYATAKKVLKRIQRTPDDKSIDFRWLVDRTEDFCQEKELTYALSKSIEIIEDPKLKNNRGEITSLLQEALGVTFDPNVGHDYLLDSKDRFAHYNKEEEKIPFDIELLNRSTLGGVTKGTLNVIIAATGVGKSLVLSHLAASYLTQNKNALYITLEMSRYEISRRIDANLFDVEMNKIIKLEENQFKKHIETLRAKTKGNLIIKQYPTAAASVLHFKHLLDELRLKKKFYPDVILIDYLNISASSRIKPSSQSGSFAYMKSVAEEFRGLAVEMDVPIFTATQTNREGAKSNDIDLSDTAESFGIPFTADFMIALMPTKDVDRMKIKILKNRYNDVHDLTMFRVGVDRKKMRLFDVDETSDFSNDNTGEEEEDYEMGGIARKTTTKKSIDKSLKKFRGRSTR